MRLNQQPTFIIKTCLIALVFLLSACGTITSRLTKGIGDNFSAAILDSDDPDTIRQALPSHLLTVDALLKTSESPDLFWAGAKLNSSYSSLFAANPQQKKRLADKAWLYAQKGACYQDKQWCKLANLSQNKLKALLAEMDASDVPTMYTLGSVWAGWLEANSSDWNAVAQLGNIQLLMQRVVELNESYELASAHVYLGVLATLMPAALGGKPEIGKEHFEKAIQLSQGRNLMAKVFYAQRYARLVFDRDLHDRLLRDVIAEKVEQPGWTLANTLAQEQAHKLLESADDYF